ncbi:MAG: polysaccharide biosynthesis/export family protein [candidate division WOR-3 bacterium]
MFIKLILLFCINAESSTYRIEPGDVLEVVVLGQEELSRDLLVMHNGNITFPLIGDIRVAGFTTNEVADTIANLLKRYFVQPLVSVILKGPSISTVAVYGEVIRPGTVNYQRGLRISDYVALAGGPSDRANLKKVRVVRNTESGVKVYTINLDNILKKGIEKENFELKAGDWVYIGRKFMINWGTVLQFATLTLTAVNLYVTIERLK